MLDSKLVSQLSAMDGRERERFRHFVHSPYFNRHVASRKLADRVLDQLGKSRPKLDRERMEKFVATLESSQSLDNLLTGLMKLLNEFLAVEQLRKEPFTESYLTVKRSERNHRIKLMHNRGKRLERDMKKYGFRDRELHLAAYRWNDLRGYQESQINRNETAYFQKMLDHLDRFWLVEKLRHACHLTANMMQLATHYDFVLLQPALDYLGSAEGQQLLAEEPSIDCYYHILMSQQEPEQISHYERMRYYLNEAIHKIAEPDRRDVFVFVTNYCIARIMSGDPSYYRELFDLYQRSVETETIFDKGEISEYDYKNVVTMGISIREFGWTEGFLDEQRERLPEEVRENAYALNKAQFLYKTGRLDEAAMLLVRVTDTEVIYHQARVLLQVRIAYDQEQFSYLFNLLETFRIYVARSKKISVRDKRSYTSFVRLTKKLITLKEQEDFYRRAELEKKLAALDTEITQTERLIGRQWLRHESRAILAPTA